MDFPGGPVATLPCRLHMSDLYLGKEDPTCHRATKPLCHNYSQSMDHTKRPPRDATKIP